MLLHFDFWQRFAIIISIHLMSKMFSQNDNDVKVDPQDTMMTPKLPHEKENGAFTKQTIKTKLIIKPGYEKQTLKIMFD